MLFLGVLASLVSAFLNRVGGYAALRFSEFLGAGDWVRDQLILVSPSAF